MPRAPLPLLPNGRGRDETQRPSARWPVPMLMVGGGAFFRHRRHLSRRPLWDAFWIFLYFLEFLFFFVQWVAAAVRGARRGSGIFFVPSLCHGHFALFFFSQPFVGFFSALRSAVFSLVQAVRVLSVERWLLPRGRHGKSWPLPSR